ncbi:hypothetical protein GcM1_217070 [Golovinomyces cichoracearum]|uniref:GAG-pre-integrase domain-containing protein n=1 Tax=Golovinomyces cichoracearum TaxID=62708 RepID=A0A420IT87_9PEZI|nr:hypothetical protein GcM1_217070 [Golovinomyces cichoracearum]
MFNLVKAQLEGQEYKDNLLTEWNNTSLRKLFLQHPEKPRTQVLKEMVEKLQQIQCGLNVEFQSIVSLKNKIKIAWANVPSCSSALLIPTDTLAGLVSDLVAAISHDDIVKKAEETEPLRTSTFFTDRKFHSNFHQQPKSGKSSHLQKKKMCFVCKKEDCWSTRHTEKEGQFARRNLENKISSYILEYEGEEKDEKSENEDNNDTNIMFFELENDDETELEHETPENFMTSTRKISASSARDYHRTLCDQSLLDRITQDEPAAYVIEGRYSSTEFCGIILDTGAVLISTAGHSQVKAYINLFGGKIDKSTAGSIRAHFGVGNTTSIGSINITSPIGTHTFHVVDAENLFLLCLQDMDRLGIGLINTKDEILKNGKVISKVVRIYNHLFLIWGPTSINFLTEVELRQLHRRFGHPTVNRLVRTLERAGHESPNHRTLLKKIQKFCTYCQRHARSPGRFKFSL